MEHGTATTKDHLVIIQVMRFVAAFSVVLFHLGGNLQSRHGFSQNLFPFGTAGVDLFFVISGFVIAHTTEGSRDLVSFLKKRVFRVVPLYYVLTFAVFLIALLFPQLLKQTVASGQNLLRSLLFIPYDRGHGPPTTLLFLGWTLCYEMFFYLCFALCMALTRRPVLLLSLLLSSLVAIGLIIPAQETLAKFYTNHILLEFLFGVWLHYIYRHHFHLLERLRPWLVLFVLALTLPLLFYPKGIQPLTLTLGLPAALIMASVLPLRLPERGIYKAMARLGDASYSLYLVHPFILTLLMGVIAGKLGASGSGLAVLAALTLAAALVISQILFRLIEAPSNKWLRAKFLAQ